jgi:hypothetical protein
MKEPIGKAAMLGVVLDFDEGPPVPILLKKNLEWFWFWFGVSPKIKNGNLGSSFG